MKVLIVEDETAAYENLTDILTEITPDIRIMAIRKVSHKPSGGYNLIRLRI